MLTRTFYNPRVVSLTLGSLVLASMLTAGPRVSGGVISGSSEGYGALVNLDGILTISTGKLGVATGTAPPVYGPLENSVVDVNADILTEVLALTTLEAIVNPSGSRTLTGRAASDVNGGLGVRSAMAEGEAENLSLQMRLNAPSGMIPVITVTSANLLKSTTTISGNYGALNAVQDSDLAGLMIDIAGTGLIDLSGIIDGEGNADPNTLISIPGVANIVLNEQGSSGGVGNRTAFTNAVHISLLGGGPLGGLATAEIIIGHSTARLTALVPEPATGVLALAMGPAVWWLRRHKQQ